LVELIRFQVKGLAFLGRPAYGVGRRPHRQRRIRRPEGVMADIEGPNAAIDGALTRRRVAF